MNTKELALKKMKAMLQETTPESGYFAVSSGGLSSLIDLLHCVNRPLPADIDLWEMLEELMKELTYLPLNYKTPDEKENK